ncbi:hypothetical protein IT411_02245 [Candidatus Peregrinibacteria bacterium]|nr:hypothetical protein [Candidatus Peregrinibacteria bacterium]
MTEQDPNKLPVEARVDQYYQQKFEYKKINGGCALKADIDTTLADLALVTKPTQENLPGKVRAALESKDAKGRKLEEIWADKVAQGATHIGILDGVVNFYKGEEKLPDDNIPLRVHALPLELELREKERNQVKDRFKEMREQFKLAFFEKKKDAFNPGEGQAGDGSDTLNS